MLQAYISTRFQALISLLLGAVNGYDRCWIFRDDFGSRSFKQFFQARKNVEYNSYVKAHFNMTGYFNNNFSCENPSVISRVSNLLVSALERKNCDGKLNPLPKLIVMVLDDDIAKLLHECDTGVAKPLSRLVNYIMTEQDWNIASFKETLSVKSLKHDYPQILWIHAPYHDGFKNNHFRERYNKCIEELAKFHNNMHTLCLKKVWDPKDSSLFLDECNRFTSAGYKAYWEAVDKTIHYFNSVVLKKHERKRNNKYIEAKKASVDQKDHFRWQNPAYNRDSEDTVQFRKLPPPPALKFRRRSYYSP